MGGTGLRGKSDVAAGLVSHLTDTQVLRKQALRKKGKKKST